MNYRFFILISLFTSTFVSNVHAQSDELFEIISLDSCDCIKAIPIGVTSEELGNKFEQCLEAYFQDNAELIEEFSKKSGEEFDLSTLGEEFGVKLGQNLIQTCPAFLERIEASQKKDESGYYEKLLAGNSLIQSEGCSSANMLYSEIISNADEVPDSTLATTYNNRGFCKSQLGDQYGAISDLNESINIVPSFSLAYNNRGTAKRKLGDYKNAILDFDKAIENNANYMAAFNGRGLSNYYLGNVDLAYSDYQKALEIDSLSGIVFFNIGLLDSYVENYESAISNFLKVYELSPEITDLSYYMSKAYYGLNRHDEAINVLLEDSLTMSDEFNLTEIGKNYYSKESYSNSIEFLSKAIEIDSNWYYPLLFRAYAFQDSGLYAQSLPDFERAFELDSSYSEIPFYHGYSLFELEEYEEAIIQFSKAIKISATYAEAFDYRARSKFKLNDFEGAVEDYSVSLKEYPDDDQIYKERGEAYLKLENKNDACTDFLLAKQFGNEEVEDLIKETCSE